MDRVGDGEGRNTVPRSNPSVGMCGVAIDRQVIEWPPDIRTRFESPATLRIWD